jgi:hypothetical protein
MSVALSLMADEREVLLHHQVYIALSVHIMPTPMIHELSRTLIQRPYFDLWRPSEIPELLVSNYSILEALLDSYVNPYLF